MLQLSCENSIAEANKQTNMYVTQGRMNTNTNNSSTTTQRQTTIAPGAII
jgi:hypothetical protein